MIVDSSAILALLLNQSDGLWVAQQLAATRRALMSTVNLTECLIRLRDRKSGDVDGLVYRLEATPLEFVAPDREQAELAAEARLRFPLNFGDCFAYALAKTLSLPLLTLDRDFRSTDIDVLLPPTVPPQA